MSPVQSRFHLRHTSRQALACGLVLCGAISASAQAQTVFRVVGPDGKVTFSDQPPAAAAQTKNPSPVATGGSSASSSSVRLPSELRKAASEFPVVLYTIKDCAPCNTARNLLINRGIPFSEKTVDNRESVAALKQLSGQASIPMLTIGSQQLKGFSETNWSQYLTTAGYPEQSALPRNYRRSSAVPLAEAKEAAPVSNAQPAEATQSTESAAPEVQVPVAPPSSGIRF